MNNNIKNQTTVIYHEKNIGSIIFLIVKSAFLYIVLSYAIYRYIKANDVYSKVIMLFGLYIILVTCLLVFELAWPQIPVLFFILIMSSMAQYW